MPEGQQGLVLHEERRMLVHRDVRGVRDVESVFLAEAHEWVLVGEEVRGPVTGIVRAVERNDPGAVAHRVGTGSEGAGPLALVVRVAPERVPTLFHERSVHDQVRGATRRIPDRERDVPLLAAVPHQLQQVVARHEGGRDRKREGGRPVVTRHHVDPRRERAGGLDLAGHHGRLPHLAAIR